MQEVSMMGGMLNQLEAKMNAKEREAQALKQDGTHSEARGYAGSSQMMQCAIICQLAYSNDSL
jgi:hypothetical protein